LDEPVVEGDPTMSRRLARNQGSRAESGEGLDDGVQKANAGGRRLFEFWRGRKTSEGGMVME
jgi:hypothetical protein